MHNIDHGAVETDREGDADFLATIAVDLDRHGFTERCALHAETLLDEFVSPFNSLVGVIKEQRCATKGL